MRSAFGALVVGAILLVSTAHAANDPAKAARRPASEKVVSMDSFIKQLSNYTTCMLQYSLPFGPGTASSLQAFCDGKDLAGYVSFKEDSHMGLDMSIIMTAMKQSPLHFVGVANQGDMFIYQK